MNKVTKIYKALKEGLISFKGAHDVYTSQEIVEKCISKIETTSSTYLVMFNIEFVISLVYTHNVESQNITFYSDHENKTDICKKLGVKYINFLEKDMKFTYTLMNPAFDISIESLRKAKEITDKKVLFIGPTRDFDKSFMLEDLEYFEPLGDKAFDEQIMTALAVYNVKGSNQTEIKFQDNTSKIVSDIKIVPAINNRIEWEFACNTISKNLSGYEAKIGKLEYSKAKVDPNGTLCIFTVGKENSNEWGNHKLIPDDQLPLTKGKGKHKLVVSKTGSIGKIGALKYAGPDIVCGFGAYFIEFDSKQDVLDNIEYIKSEPVVKLVKGIKTNTVVNGQRLWSLIPKLEHKDKWI